MKLEEEADQLFICRHHITTLKLEIIDFYEACFTSADLFVSGGLHRIEGKDADALGRKVAEVRGVGSGKEAGEEEVWAVLKTCYDPEIPVNIVDLGLIYSMELKNTEGGGKRADVKMTLTAQGCGMGPSIAADARQKILSLSGVQEAQVDVVWDPPWGPQMITPDGRKKLGMD